MTYEQQAAYIRALEQGVQDLFDRIHNLEQANVLLVSLVYPETMAKEPVEPDYIVRAARA